MADPLSRIVSVGLLPLSSLTLSDGGLVLSVHPSASWMDPILAYLRDGILPKKGNCIKGHIQDPIYCACILRLLKHFWKSCMKGYVETLWEEGL